jgi:hypothetical protein
MTSTFIDYRRNNVCVLVVSSGLLWRSSVQKGLFRVCRVQVAPAAGHMHRKDIELRIHRKRCNHSLAVKQHIKPYGQTDQLGSITSGRHVTAFMLFSFDPSPSTGLKVVNTE